LYHVSYISRPINLLERQPFKNYFIPFNLGGVCKIPSKEILPPLYMFLIIESKATGEPETSSPISNLCYHLPTCFMAEAMSSFIGSITSVARHFTGQLATVGDHLRANHIACPTNFANGYGHAADRSACSGYQNIFPDQGKGEGRMGSIPQWVHNGNDLIRNPFIDIKAHFQPVHRHILQNHPSRLTPIPTV